MIKKLLSVLLLGLCMFSNAQKSDVSGEVESFKAGGTPIAIPAPTTAMNEVGYDNRELMEVFVPSVNRLIAAFVLTEDLPKLSEGADDLKMAQYAMVQVPRQGEYMDCGASDFKEVTEGAKESFGEVLSSSFEEAENEFNQRMKALDLDEATVQLGDPIQLGCLFSKKDAYAFGMIIPVKTGEETIQMSMSCVLMRVKNRLLFLYLYAEYKNEETVKWLRKTSESWVDSVLTSNK